MTIWLTDAADFAEFNKAYAAYLGDHRPVRSTVRCDLVIPGAKIEIEALAGF
ncbi:RidA family protein [Colwellia sp. MEBiC06753]